MSRKQRTTPGEIIRNLLAKRGITRYALFLTQYEGKALPGVVESISGFVLTIEGEVYGFWLDWDNQVNRYVLDPWYHVENPAEFASDPEYLRARRSLGTDRNSNHVDP